MLRGKVEPARQLLGTATIHVLRVDGAPASLERRLRWTIAQSARPLLIADLTTAFSLFINCVSPMRAIFQFGLSGGVLIMVNFLLVLVHMPALLVLDERGIFRRAILFCTADETTSHNRKMRLLHSLHANLFKWRRITLLVFFCVIVALLPRAFKLTTVTSGSDLGFYAEAAQPPPSSIA